MRRIILIHHGRSKGGAPISLAILGKALKMNGDDVIVLGSGDDPELSSFFESWGLSYENVILRYFPHTELGWLKYTSIKDYARFGLFLARFPLSVLALRNIIKKFDADIVHLNSITLTFLTPFLKSFGSKIVIHVREPIVKGYFGIRRWMMRKIIEQSADAVVAICKQNLDVLSVSASEQHVVENPVDDRFFTIPNRAANRDKHHILFLGGCDPYIKGIRDFIRFVRIAESEIKELAIHIVADKQQCGCEEIDIIENGNFEDIRLYGFIRDVPRLLEDIDIVYVLHQKPHFSRTVIESFAAGRAVIGFDVEGVGEYLAEVNELLAVPKGDIHMLVERTRILLDDKELYQRIAVQARELSRRRFSSAGHYESISKIYNKILQR